MSILAVVALVVMSLPAMAADLGPACAGVRYERIGSYTVERLNRIMGKELSEFSAFKTAYPAAKNAVDLYRVTYDTVIPEQNNRPVRASGLLAVPRVAKRTLPVLSYQHGTVFSRTAVPSNPEESMETRLMIARFAGDGYVVIGADYIGKGLSAEPDSYMVKEATAQACLDMLFASRAVCRALNIEQGDLFLSGWSQGAWSTMVFRHRLESLGISVKAAATASTPNDLYMLLTRWINNPTALDASYLVALPVLFINSYERYYGMSGLSRTAIKPQYWQAANDFYENRIGWDEAAKLLPATVADLLQPEFAAASSMAASPFFRQLQDNQAYRWRSATPSRYYFGKADEVMPPAIATLPVEYTRALGGAAAEAVYAGDEADHRGTFLYGAYDQKVWFDSLLRR
ncbi:hypothetical protein [Fundidesulfovibrio agrisoli]|uniref:hypothetical protein n=1 Tax=Fundidesulfovibrio agrisoli TaxID=2922717 RepID=UPI001FACF9EE|nr:hypothetical protein [Fundidesulfovibrio agrisoli]